MNTKRDYGFTLIEVLVAVAILAVLASVAIYNVKAGDKISEAEALVLKQNLVSYIPEQIKFYYLRGDSAAWSNRVAQIKNEMASWPHLQSISFTARVYKNDGVELKFRTIYQSQSRNERLRDILSKSAMVESVTISDSNGHRFLIKYKLN